LRDTFGKDKIYESILMNNNKLRTASLLIAISILLLVVFQVYWIGKNWDDTYRRLRREVSVILRETVVRQQMSRLMDGHGNFRLSGNDSTTTFLNIRRTPNADHIVVNKIDTTDTVRVVVMKDTGVRGKSRTMSFDMDRPPEDNDDGGSIVVEFPMLKGSGNIDTIKARFSQGLKEVGIGLDFTVNIVPIDTARRGGGRQEMWFRGNGMGNSQFAKMNWVNIQAVSSNTFFVVLQKMLWQLVFSVAMTAVIIAALVFLWRNLRLQHRLAEQKNDLIANITHELKTPIATVSVAIEALKNFNAIHDAERTKEYLNISGYELQRLNMLVDKVLKLSMFEQGKISIQHEKVDVKQVVEEVLDSMRLQFQKQLASVNFEVPDTDFIVEGDKMHLLSVLYNLLDNAVKYSKKAPVITIKLSKTAECVELQVSDNGMGIAPEHSNKIFEKFYRIPHGDTHNIKGYGLGLSYVSEVITRHGGKIWVNSELGKGSTFNVELPISC
jgi:two-component system phosphate regulon sensor histidine kinase PhoR